MKRKIYVFSHVERYEDAQIEKEQLLESTIDKLRFHINTVMLVPIPVWIIHELFYLSIA